MLGFPTTGDCTQMSNAYTTNPMILRTSALGDVATAIAAGNRVTSAISQGSCTEAEYASLIAEFRGLGYSVTLGSGSFTIAWQ